MLTPQLHSQGPPAAPGEVSGALRWSLEVAGGVRDLGPAQSPSLGLRQSKWPTAQEAGETKRVQGGMSDSSSIVVCGFYSFR